MSKFITLDDRHLRAFERDVKAFVPTALTFANRQALNQAAAMTERHIRQLLPKKLTLRNQFTMGSIRKEKATQKNIRHQRSIVGSISPYLRTIEFGGAIRATGKQGVPIPSRSAAGEGRGDVRSKQPVRAANTRRRITISRRRTRGGGKGGGRESRNQIAFRGAVESGRKYVYMDTRKGPGIFKVVGGKRKPKAELMWSLSRKTVPVHARPWLRPTVKFIAPKVPTLYREALRQQVIRHGLFKTRR